MPEQGPQTDDLRQKVPDPEKIIVQFRHFNKRKIVLYFFTIYNTACKGAVLSCSLFLSDCSSDRHGCMFIWRLRKLMHRMERQETVWYMSKIF